MIKKRPLSASHQEKVKEIKFVTPCLLLTGYALNIAPNYALPQVQPQKIQSKDQIKNYSKRMKRI